MFYTCRLHKRNLGGKVKIIDDFLVDNGKESHVGILIKHKEKALWIFNNAVHGSYLAFGDNPNVKRNQRWLNK